MTDEEKYKNLARMGYDLSQYAASIQWDGSSNTREWIDGLHDEITKLQQEYRDVFGED